MKKISILLLFLAVIMTACERKIDEFSPDSNGVDFSKFVAVGNSLTAGYADGALYTSGQTYSIPNIIAGQMKTVGGGEFLQPLMGSEDGVGFVQIPNAPPPGIFCYTKRVLGVVEDTDPCTGNGLGTYGLKPVFANPNATQTDLLNNLFAPPTVQGPYNNVGVPGATLQAMLYDQYPYLNPFYTRFFGGNPPPAKSMLQYALEQQPTFMYMWIGNNDVLLPAINGTDYGITPADTFNLYYNQALGAIRQSGVSKGVVANIPDVTSIPYFTTVRLPLNGITLTADQAQGLNILYSMYGHGDVTWTEGLNSFVIVTKTGQWRHMTANDLFILTTPTDSIACPTIGMGIAHQDPVNISNSYPFPIRAEYVLDEDEVANITARVAQYNQTILNAANTNDFAFVDMNSHLKEFAAGMTFDGITFNTRFVEGGLFSLDGVHLCPRGYAQTANFFIDAINNKYGCNIPKVSVTNYPGIKFP